MASDPEIINNYYDLLECTLCDNDLMEKPAQIFNLDETGMPLDPSPPLVVARRSQKHPSAVGSGEKWCSYAPVLLDMLSFPVLF